MAINVLGINHKTAPIEIREKLVFDKESLPHALTDIKNIDGVNGVILLSTCNRTEVYTENDYDNSKIIEWLKNQNMTRDISDFTYNYYEEKAIKHGIHTKKASKPLTKPGFMPLDLKLLKKACSGPLDLFEGLGKTEPVYVAIIGPPDSKKWTMGLALRYKQWTNILWRQSWTCPHH